MSDYRRYPQGSRNRDQGLDYATACGATDPWADVRLARVLGYTFADRWDYGPEGPPPITCPECLALRQGPLTRGMS